MKQVDLNADMGESFGTWKMGDDAALLNIVSSANIACGAHAGDPDVMAATMALARDNGVGIGTHPGFPDLQGFGRRRMHVPIASLQNSIRVQVGGSLGMARALGTKVRHLKLHGAMSNMTCEDESMAYALYEAALSVDPNLIIMVLAATEQVKAVQSLGCAYACEIFADRAYNDDATLVDRSKQGAVIHDAELCRKTGGRDGAGPSNLLQKAANTSQRLSIRFACMGMGLLQFRWPTQYVTNFEVIQNFGWVPSAGGFDL